MNVHIGPRGTLQIDGAKIVFRNFAGAASVYNKKGDRNFAVIIPDQEIADSLIEQGWNVKIKPPREEGDTPFMYMSVKVNFNGRGPRVYLVSDRNTTVLDENNVACLDRIDIASVDMDIRPYDWERPDGASGRSAYLQAIRVYQEVDRFASSFNSQPGFGGEDDGYPFE